MSELHAFLENQKERWQLVQRWADDTRWDIISNLCDESIKDIDFYLERHKPPLEEYEHYGKHEKT